MGRQARSWYFGKRSEIISGESDGSRDGSVIKIVNPRMRISGIVLFNHLIQLHRIHAHVPNGINVDGVNIWCVVMNQLERLHHRCAMIIPNEFQVDWQPTRSILS